ncbi:MAG: hypothetical protein GY898_12735 [Proteobacteria bacterium]|nr:hypothetical protein [Pseudomonadota bacterium]
MGLPTLLALAVLASGTALGAERTAASTDGRWLVRIADDGGFVYANSDGQTLAQGQLPQVPDQVAVLRSGKGFVAVDALGAWGLGDAVVLVDGDGVAWARLGMADLYDEATVERFWTPDGGSIAWRVDWWVDEARERVVFVPDAPGQPVAVSLNDGLVENPAPDLYVRRMESPGLWFGSRLRALDLSVRTSPEPPTLMPALRRIVREQDAPLVLRLRAAAVLQQHGDPAGRGLVLLTARAAPQDADALAALPPEELRRLPEPDHPCDAIPAPAVDHPYDHRAARSYAIQLLPTFLGAEAAPRLGELLAGDDEQDRFDSLQAIACLAQRQPGTTEALLLRVQQRHERETERLSAISSIVPLRDMEIPLDLAGDADSLDVAAAAEAVEGLLARAPTSNPVLFELLRRGSRADVRIASHLSQHPDPRATAPLLVALERYRDTPGTNALMIEALAACAHEGSPGATASVQQWLDWGRAWKRSAALRWSGQLALAVLPFLALVGLSRRRD